MADNETDPMEPAPTLLTEPKPPAPQTLNLPKPDVRRGWVALMVGGALAAVAGFGLAQYVPEGWPLGNTIALQSSVTTQQLEIDRLKAALTAISVKPDDTILGDRVAALESQAPIDLTSLQTRLSAVEESLASIEAMPVNGEGASAAAFAAQAKAIESLQSQLAGLQGTVPDASAMSDQSATLLKQAEASAAKITAEAEAAAKSAQAEAALGRVQAALDSGAAYASALPALGDIPAVLKDNAETGLPTLATLRDTFPVAGRAALEAALRANMGETWGDRVGNFLRTQTGARSLSPRAGNDPDAILSRAEAALGSGDIVAALSELSALPAEAQSAMADWRTLAETRQAGINAVAGLAATLKQ